MLASSVQGFKRVRVREAVVLTPECTAANSKPCIFPAALSHATNWADSGYYPACWEKDTDDYRCATEVKYDEVKMNLLLNKACHAVYRYLLSMLFIARRISSWRPLRSPPAPRAASASSPARTSGASGRTSSAPATGTGYSGSRSKSSPGSRGEMDITVPR